MHVWLLCEVSTPRGINLYLAPATLLRATSVIVSVVLAAHCNGEEGYEGSGSPGTEEAPPQGDEGGKGSEVSASPG